jgi:hypothetical protein
MRQSRLLVQQVFNRPRRIDHFRRRAWTVRRVHRPNPQEILIAREYIPGEFDEPSRWAAIAPLRRGIGLMSDAIVLTLASPFFGIWFLYRAVRRWQRAAN